MAEQSNPGLKAIITGVLLGVASAALGGYTMYSGTVADPETDISAAKGDGSLTARAEKVKETLKRDFTIVDTAPAGAVINGQPRLAPLFFSTELWQITRDDAKEVTVVDIYDPAAPSIHGDIPNTWFISNNIADALGRSDGRILDSDSDGFTNEEEFAAKTCPSAANSYPDLAHPAGSAPKLEVLKVSVARAIITTDNMFGDISQKPTTVNIRIYGKPTDVLPLHKVAIKPGESFGLSKDDKSGRFTLVRFDTKEYADYGGNMNKENVIVVRDNETASNEKEFVIRAGKTPAGHKDMGTPNEKGRRISDTSVTLRVTAGSAAGKPEGEIRTQLYGSFLIPGGKSDGAELRATLESVDASGSVNIRLEGAESPINVPKAAKQDNSPKK